MFGDIEIFDTAIIFFQYFLCHFPKVTLCNVIYRHIFPFQKSLTNVSFLKLNNCRNKTYVSYSHVILKLIDRDGFYHLLTSFKLNTKLPQHWQNPVSSLLHNIYRPKFFVNVENLNHLHWNKSTGFLLIPILSQLKIYNWGFSFPFLNSQDLEMVSVEDIITA